MAGIGILRQPEVSKPSLVRPPAPVATHQNDIAALTPGTQLRLLMVYWRQRLRPSDLPKHVSNGRGRRIKYVSQEDVARAAKVATRWYAKLERGELENGFGAELLGRVAAVLKLDEDERTFLFLLACGIEPAHIPCQRPITVGPAFRALLDCFPSPAYITDEIWTVLAVNDPTRQCLPHVELGANLMRWMFCQPGARRQLVDWETVHAPLMLAQLRAQYARMPQAPEMLELIRDVLAANAFARELWTTRPIVSLQGFTGPRQMYFSGSDLPITTTVLSVIPAAKPEIRITMVIPIDAQGSSTTSGVCT